MQRYQFPPKWLELEMIEGEWGAFNEILKRKDAAIQSQVAPLSHKIVQESKLVEQKTSDLLNDWEKGRPVQVCIQVVNKLYKLYTNAINKLQCN